MDPGAAAPPGAGHPHRCVARSPPVGSRGQLLSPARSCSTSSNLRFMHVGTLHRHPWLGHRRPIGGTVAACASEDAVARSDTVRNAAARPRTARSAPANGSRGLRRSRNAPKLPIRTPTESFSVFSGTRVSGPRSASAASATATAAPTAPRLAGTIMWPTAPTARTMKTTSRPSRTTALKVVTSATGSHRVAVASAVPASAAVAPSNARRSSWSGMIPPLAARPSAASSARTARGEGRRPAGGR